MPWPPPSSSQGPLVIAHRGASGSFPENTELAFRAALHLGVRTWECDVRLSRDGAPVVIHDASVDRTTDGAGFVNEMTLADIRRLTAGFPRRFGDRFVAQRVPTLEEVLRLARGEARLLVEIKTDEGDAPSTPRLVDAVLRQIEAAGALGETAAVSFDPVALALVRRSCPSLPAGLLVARGASAGAIDEALSLGLRFLIPAKELLTDELSSEVRAAGLLLATYTIDAPEEITSLARCGLYAAATDFPERFVGHAGVRPG